MKVVCDTNIFVDVLLKQKPFAVDSAKIMLLASPNTWQIYLPASSITDIFYIIASRTHSRDMAYQAVGRVLSIATICAVTKDEVQEAYNRREKDFEDCLLAVCAESLQADFIITRDKKGFINAKIPTVNPAEFLNSMEIE